MAPSEKYATSPSFPYAHLFGNKKQQWGPSGQERTTKETSLEVLNTRKMIKEMLQVRFFKFQ